MNIFKGYKRSNFCQQYKLAQTAIFVPEWNLEYHVFAFEAFKKFVMSANKDLSPQVATR